LQLATIELMRNVSLGLALSASLSAACGGLVAPEVDPAKLPGPILIGRIDTGLRAAGEDPPEIAVAVDGAPRSVFVAPDGTFAVRSLPEGSARIELAYGEARTELVLAPLERGAVFEVVVNASPAEIQVASSFRREGVLAYDLPVRRAGGVDIAENDAVFFLEPGDYAGGLVVRGRRVVLLGDNADEPCEERGRARLRGDLEIRGSDVRVLDVAPRGVVRIGGEAVRVHSPCDGLWRGTTAPRRIDDAGGRGPLIDL